MKTGNWDQEPESQNIYHPLHFLKMGFIWCFIPQKIIFLPKLSVGWGAYIDCCLAGRDFSLRSTEAPSLHCRIKTQVCNLGCLNCSAEDKILWIRVMWPYISMGQENNSSLQWTFKLHENIILMLSSSQTAHSVPGVLWKGRENNAEDIILRTPLIPSPPRGHSWRRRATTGCNKDYLMSRKASLHREFRSQRIPRFGKKMTDE